MKEIIIPVLSEFDVLKARKLGREITTDRGFDDMKISEIEIVISELGMNLVKHRAVEGELVFKIIEKEVNIFEIISRDKGPGIKDLTEAMTDGVSTSGTLGIGLSVVKRLTDEFFIDSKIGVGTTVIVKKYLSFDKYYDIKFSVFAKPKEGENVSGDAYFIKRFPSSVFFSVIDTLGHGYEAYLTARKAIEILENCCAEHLLTIIEICHRELRNTRGAAMTLRGKKHGFTLRKQENI